MYDAPLSQVFGASGLPSKSTEGKVGLALVVAVVMGLTAFPGTHPSQCRKIPLRAASVKTVLDWRARVREICWSHSAKKNVLFLMIGPP